MFSFYLTYLAKSISLSSPTREAFERDTDSTENILMKRLVISDCNCFTEQKILSRAPTGNRSQDLHLTKMALYH